MGENKEVIDSLISDEAFAELERYNSLLDTTIEKVEHLLSLQNKLSPTDKGL